MDSTRNQARYAGLLYGLASSAAPFAYLYVPGALIVQGDALATADRVRASEGLLRAAVVGELYGATLLIFATLALHRLFRSVDPRHSSIMAAMMLVSVPISYANALNHLAPLVLLGSPALEGLLDPAQVAAQVTFFLRLHAHGLFVGQILWGLWLFPIGVLIMRSGFIPRWLAYPLFLAGAGYVLNSLGMLVLPPAWRWTTEYLQILGLGELPLFSFYLLIWGARGHAVDRVAAALVLTLFALGMAGFVLLNLDRIDVVQYGAIKLVALMVVIVLVLRWRWESRRDGRRPADPVGRPSVPLGGIRIQP